MGKANKTVEIELSLDVDAQGAKQQVANVVKQIGSMIEGIGRGANFKYFKELEAYLDRLEARISVLQKSNPNIFKNLFGENGANLESELLKAVGGFGDKAQEAVKMYDSITAKMNTLGEGKGKGALNNMREVANEIKALAQMVGANDTLDIDKMFTGNGSATKRMEALREALSNIRGQWNSFAQEAVQFHIDNVLHDYDTLKQKLTELQKLNQSLKGAKPSEFTSEQKQLNDRRIGLSGEIEQIQDKLGIPPEMLSKINVNFDAISDQSLDNLFERIKNYLYNDLPSAAVFANQALSQVGEHTEGAEHAIKTYEAVKNAIMQYNQVVAEAKASGVSPSQYLKDKDINREKYADAARNAAGYKEADKDAQAQAQDIWKVIKASGGALTDEQMSGMAAKYLQVLGKEIPEAGQAAIQAFDALEAAQERVGKRAKGATDRVKKDAGEAKEEAVEAKKEAESSSGEATKTKAAKDSLAEEKAEVAQLAEEINTVLIKAINDKNEAFDAELNKVKEVVQAEKAEFESLASYLSGDFATTVENKLSGAEEKVGKKLEDTKAKIEQQKADNAVSEKRQQRREEVNTDERAVQRYAQYAKSWINKQYNSLGIAPETNYSKKLSQDSADTVGNVRSLKDTMLSRIEEMVKEEDMTIEKIRRAFATDKAKFNESVNRIIEHNNQERQKMVEQNAADKKLKAAVAAKNTKLDSYKNTVNELFDRSGVSKYASADEVVQQRKKIINAINEQRKAEGALDAETDKNIQSQIAEMKALIIQREEAAKATANIKKVRGTKDTIDLDSTRKLVENTYKKFNISPVARNKDELLNGQTVGEVKSKYESIMSLLDTYGQKQRSIYQSEAKELRSAIEELERYAISEEKARKLSVQRQNDSYRTKDYAKEVATYESLKQKVETSYNDSPRVVQAMSNYTKQMDALRVERTIADQLGDKYTANAKAKYDRLAESVAKAGKEVDGLVKASDKLAATGKLITKDFDTNKMDDASQRAATLRHAFDALGEKGATFEKLSADSNKLFYTIKNGDGTVQRMALEFNAARTAIIQTSGDVVKTTNAFNQLFNSIKSRAKFFVTSMGLRYVWQEFKKGVGYVKELDAAMVELRKVSSGTESEYATLLNNLKGASGDVARTTTDLVKSAADWARSGMSLKDSELLAKNTAILMNTSDITDASQASDLMISTMKAYRYEAEDTMSMIDKFNAVGNNFAISTSQAADSLTRSGAALYAAGNNLEQSLAMTAAANTFVQNPESVGNALKTLSMRIRGTKVELEEAGEDTTGMATSVSKLREQVMALTNTKGLGGFDILKDDRSYKSTYDILLGISKVWKEMSDIDQAALLELIAGKRQGSIVSGILESPELLEEAYAKASDSAGYAMEKNEEVLSGVEGKLNRFKASLQTMWQNALSSDVLKFFLDLGNGIVSVTDKLGGLNVAVGALFAVLSKKLNVNIFKGLFGEKDPTTGKRTGSWFDTLLGGGKGGRKWTVDTVSKNGIGMENFIAGFNKSNLSGKEFAQANIDDLTESQKAYFKTCEQGKASMVGYTASVETHNAALKTSSVVSKLAAVGQQLFNAAISFGIGLLLSGAITAITNWIHKQEEMAKAAKEASEEYEKANKTYESNAKTISEIGSEYDKLAKGVDENGKNISLSADEFERYHEITSQIADMFPALVSGYDEQGNAILDLADKTKTATEQLNEFNDAEKRAAAGELMKKQNEIIQTVKSKVTSNDYGMNSEDYLWQQAVKIAKGEIDVNTLTDDDAYRLIAELNKRGLTEKKATDYMTGVEHGTAYYVQGLHNDLGEILREKTNQIVTAAQPATAEVKTALNDLFKLIDSYGQYNDAFVKLDKTQQNIVQKLIHNIPQQDLIDLIPDFENNPESTANRLYDVFIRMVSSQGFTDVYKQINDYKNNIGQNTKLKTSIQEINNLKEQIEGVVGYNNDWFGGLIGDNGIMGAALSRILSIDTEQFEQNAKALDNAIYKGEEYERDLDSIYKRLGNLSRAEINFAGSHLDLAGEEGDLLSQLGEGRARSYIRKKMQEEGVFRFDPVESYDDLKIKADAYAKALSVVNEIAVDNTALTKDQAEALEAVLGDLSVYKDAVDDNNVVKSTAKLREALLIKRTDISSSRHVMQMQYGDLVNQLGRSVREYADSLTDVDDAQWNNIQSLMEQITSVDNAISRYEMLETQIMGTTDAYEDFQKAQEIDSATDTASEMVDMYTAIKEGLESGKVGSQTFQAAVKALVPYEIWGKFEEDGQSAIDSIETYYNQTLSRYMSAGDNGVEITQDGVEAFLQDLIDAGTLTGTVHDFQVVAGKTIEDAMEDLRKKGVNITKTTMFDMMQAFQSYNVDWEDYPLFDMMEASKDFDSQLFMAQENLASMYSKLATLRQNNTDGSNTLEIAKLKVNIDDAEREFEVLNEHIIDQAKEKHEIEYEIQGIYNDYGENSQIFQYYKDLREGGMGHDEALKEVKTTFNAEFDDTNFNTSYENIKDKLDRLNNPDNKEYLGNVTETAVQSSVNNIQARIDAINHELERNPNAGVKVKLEAEKEELESYLQEAEDMGFTIEGEFSLEESFSNIEDILGEALKLLAEIAGVKPEKGSVLDKLTNGELTSADDKIEQYENTRRNRPEIQAETKRIERYENTRRNQKDLSLEDKKRRQKMKYDLSHADEDLVNGAVNKSIQITPEVNDEKAKKKLKELNDTEIKNKDVNVKTEGTEETINQINEINDKDVKDKDLKVNGENKDAIKAVDDVNNKKVKDKESKITVDSSSAQKTTSNFMSWFLGQPDKTVLLKADATSTKEWDAITRKWQNLTSTTKTLNLRTTINASEADVNRWENVRRKGSNADGNAHALGTAFAGGHWGAPRTEEALVGELGPEIVVTPATGRWRTVGDNGAEFTKIRSGDIIFNHLQTEQLLKNRHITSRGSSFASGTAYSGTKEKEKYTPTSTTPKTDTGKDDSKKDNKSNNNSEQKVKTATEKAVDKYAKFVDWVTVKLDRAASLTEQKVQAVEDNATNYKREYKDVGKNKGDYTYNAKTKKYSYAGVNKGKYDIKSYWENNSPAIKSINEALSQIEADRKINEKAQTAYLNQFDAFLKEAKISGRYRKVDKNKGAFIYDAKNKKYAYVGDGKGDYQDLTRGYKAVGKGKGDYTYDSKTKKYSYAGAGKGNYTKYTIKELIKNGNLKLNQYPEDVQSAIQQAQSYYNSYLDAGKTIAELDKQKKDLTKQKFQRLVEYYDTLVDWVAVKLDRIATVTQDKVDAIDNYTQRLDTSYVSKGKNKGSYKKQNGKYVYVGKNKGNYAKNTGVLGAINEAISATNKEIKTNQSGYQRYLRQARDFAIESGLSSDIIDKIKNGKIEIRSYDENTRQKIEEYQEWYEKALNCQKAVKDLKKQEADLYAQRFDEIEQYYGNRIGQIETKSDLLSAKEELAQAKGYYGAKNYALEQIDLATEQRKQLNAERSKLLKEFQNQVAKGKIKVGSKEWYEHKQAIDDVTKAIYDADKAIEDYTNSLGDIHFNNFDKLRNQFADLNTELSNIYDILSKKDVFKYTGKGKELGNWTNEGLTSIAMAAQEMELAIKDAENIKAQINYLNKNETRTVNGKKVTKKEYQWLGYSATEYKEKLAELTQQQWESIDAYESAKDKIQSLNSARVQAIKDGIQKEIDAMTELTDKRKKDLQSQKEAHDFEKRVTEQKKSVAKIQSQIDALSADSSAAAAAKRKKLEAELLDEQENLDEIYYDHKMELSEKDLDESLELYRKNKEEIVKGLEESLDDIEKITKTSIEAVRTNASKVRKELSDLEAQYSVDISNYIQSSWAKGKDALGEYSNYHASKTAEWIKQLDNVKKAWDNTIKSANEAAKKDIAKTNTDMKATNTSTAKKTTTINTKKATTTNTLTNGVIKGAESAVKSTQKYPKVGSKVKIDSGAKTWADGKMFSMDKSKSYQVSAVDTKNGVVTLIITPAVKDKNGKITKQAITRKIKVKDLQGYASGTLGVRHGGLAKTDEFGLEELVLHAGKDGKIQYLTKGTGVLPNKLTKNIMKWGKLDPRQILVNNTPTPPSASNFTHNTVNLNVGEIVHIDHADRDSIPDITKAVKDQMDKYFKQVNTKLRIKT